MRSKVGASYISHVSPLCLPDISQISPISDQKPMRSRVGASFIASAPQLARVRARIRVRVRVRDRVGVGVRVRVKLHRLRASAG